MRACTRTATATAHASEIGKLYRAGVSKSEIARRLHVSQARVSRLLKQAELDGIVRTTVIVPE